MAKPTSVPHKVTIINEDSTVEKYKSLDAAIAATDDGDTLQLKSGTYDIGTLSVDDDISIVGAKNGKTVLDGGIQLSADAETFSVSGLTIENGTPTDDWAGVNIGIYAFGSTDISVTDVTFQDNEGDVDMVGISARTAGPGADEGAVFDIADSTFTNLANGVDVQSGVSATIESSTFENTAIVTNSNDLYSDALTVANSNFIGDSGIVFVEGDTWMNLNLVNNTGNDDYYIYGSGSDPVVLDQGIDVVGVNVEVQTTEPYFT